MWRFFSNDLAEAACKAQLPDAVRLPEKMTGWGPLERAQYLESSIFLTNFLLSSQSDRMSMAHAVEGRSPFLDFRVAEFCARLPSRLKLRVLTEKYLLRRMAAPLLPRNIATRRKRPYRAPIHRAFFQPPLQPYVEELLSEPSLRESGLFNAAAVEQLVARLKSGARIGETDDMALAGILSTELVRRQFVTVGCPRLYRIATKSRYAMDSAFWQWSQATPCSLLIQNGNREN
jgi:asparagine synthase (glutamine-hydrolysing)